MAAPHPLIWNKNVFRQYHAGLPSSEVGFLLPCFRESLASHGRMMSSRCRALRPGRERSPHRLAGTVHYDTLINGKHDATLEGSR